MADLQGIEHCHLRIETVAWNGANSASSIKQGQQITQIHLKFRIRGIDREITGEPINHNGSGVPGNMLLAALRSAIDRAELPPAARGINRGSQRPARW